jgi:hypothetical protein
MFLSGQPNTTERSALLVWARASFLRPGLELVKCADAFRFTFQYGEAG